MQNPRYATCDTQVKCVGDEATLLMEWVCLYLYLSRELFSASVSCW